MKKPGFIRWAMVAVWMAASLSAWAGAAYEEPMEAGIALFDQGDFDQAYTRFLEAFDQDPDNMLVNFYLGRSAFESGNYEMAVMVFERMLISDPANLRVKLEIARAYFRLGLNDLARQQCRDVLAADPPEPVKKNIEDFLALIDRSEKKHFFSGTLTLGGIYNDNIWSAPSSRIIQSEVGDIELTGEASDRDKDWVLNTGAELFHRYLFPYSPWAWQTSAVLVHNLYVETAALNTFYTRVMTGPDRMLGPHTLGLRLTGTHFTLDGSTYQTGLGPRVQGLFFLSSRLHLSGYCSGEFRDFPDQADRDGWHGELGMSGNWLLGRSWLGLDLTGAAQDARDDQYAYHRVGARARIRGQLVPGLTGTVSYEYQISDYRGENPVFGRKREDRIHYIEAGLSKQLWQSPDRARRLNLKIEVLRTRALSNIGLYDFTRNMVQTGVEYLF